MVKNAPPGRKSVLLADDNPELLRALQGYLEARDFRVEVSLDLHDALEKTRSLKPDLVILDYLFGVRTSHEALESIRADPETRDIPVLVFSAVPPEQLQRLVGSTPMTYVLSKVFPLAGLLEAIRRILGES